MKLTDVEIGKSVTVKSLSLPHEAERRFEVLGMIVGTNISVINRAFSGAVIIRLRGTRFAVGRDFCEKIEVDYE